MSLVRGGIFGKRISQADNSRIRARTHTLSLSLVLCGNECAKKRETEERDVSSAGQKRGCLSARCSIANARSYRL